MYTRRMLLVAAGIMWVPQPAYAAASNVYWDGRRWPRRPRNVPEVTYVSTDYPAAPEPPDPLEGDWWEASD